MECEVIIYEAKVGDTLGWIRYMEDPKKILEKEREVGPTKQSEA